MKFRLLFLLLFLLHDYAYPQVVGDWEIYPSLRTVNDLIMDKEQNVWAATNGGVFSFDGDNFTSYSTLDGLSNQQGTAITYDVFTNQVFVGYGDGRIDVINTENEEIITISDISRAEGYTSKRVNDLQIYNSKLYAAVDFGIIVLDLNTLLVEESYLQLGEINRASPVMDLHIQNDTIVAGTQSGLSLGNINDELSLQSNWTTYNEDDGFVSQQVLAVILWSGNIYASTAGQNYLFENGSWSVNESFGSNVIQDYAANNNTLFALSTTALFTSKDEGDTFENFSLGKNHGISISAMADSEFIYFGTLNSGLGRFHLQEQWIDFIAPEGPYLNLFTDLKFSKNGMLLAASTNSSSRNSEIDRSRGYYLFDGEVWQNFNQQTSDALRAANFMLTFTTAETDNYYYVGSWGEGVVRHHKETDEITVFNSENSTLRGWEDDGPFYPVISGLAADSENRMWLVSRFADSPLYYQIPDNDEWNMLPKNTAAANTEYFKLFIDSNDQKWISLQNTSAAGAGLLVLNTGEPGNPDDDQAVRLTANENSGNLPDLQVKAIVEDKNGEIWVGTERGIARYIFPELIISGGAAERRGQWLINEDTTAVSRFLLRDVNVSAMAVNSANEKWIGTVNQGIFVVDEDGSRIIKRLTKENSFLNSNRVSSIAIEHSTGKVFIATDTGLMSYQDVPRQAVTEMDELKVYPNPFSYNRHSEILIEGLSDMTTVKVVGVDGNVFQEIEARVGRINWNGLDYSGNKLGSGVYFIVAYEENGSRGIGKVVIVR